MYLRLHITKARLTIDLERAPGSALRRDHRNHLPAVATINAKVAVERENATVGIYLRHADQTGICQGHRNAGVTRHQFFQLGAMILDFERDSQQSIFDPLENDAAAHTAALDQETGFRDDCLAGEEWRR